MFENFEDFKKYFSDYIKENYGGSAHCFILNTGFSIALFYYLFLSIINCNNYKGPLFLFPTIIASFSLDKLKKIYK